MTGIWQYSNVSLILAHNSIPSIPGIIMSDTTRSTGFSAKRHNASSPPDAISMWKYAASRLDTSTRSSSLSSTIRIVYIRPSPATASSGRMDGNSADPGIKSAESGPGTDSSTSSPE